MRKKKTELQRIETLIKSDRYNLKDDFNDLLLGDLTKLLSDFFDFKGSPSLELIKTGNGFTINITLSASGIRAFSSVPRD